MSVGGTVMVAYIYIYIYIYGAWGSVVVKALRCGSIPGGVTEDFFRGSFRQNHVP